MKSAANQPAIAVKKTAIDQRTIQKMCGIASRSRKKTVRRDRWRSSSSESWTGWSGHGAGVYDAREMALTRDDVLQAAERIRGRVHRTPTFSSRTLGERTYLKAELFQKTGSFKARGVLNKLSSLTPEEKERGVIGISAGNHAQALAWGAALGGDRLSRRHVRERERGEGRGDAGRTAPPSISRRRTRSRRSSGSTSTSARRAARSCTRSTTRS